MEMDPAKFDELTKVLATASSRRQALRRIGGILGGTALAGLFPGVALADNSACAHCCSTVFGGDTPAQAQCTSDAAHHTGLCYTCGPASPGGTQPICCQENPDGTCTSYSSATCCSSDQICSNGQCVTPTTTTPPPAQFQATCVCNDGTVLTQGCTDFTSCKEDAGGCFKALCVSHGGPQSFSCQPCP